MSVAQWPLYSIAAYPFDVHHTVALRGRMMIGLRWGGRGGEGGGKHSFCLGGGGRGCGRGRMTPAPFRVRDSFQNLGVLSKKRLSAWKNDRPAGWLSGWTIGWFRGGNNGGLVSLSDVGVEDGYKASQGLIWKA